MKAGVGAAARGRFEDAPGARTSPVRRQARCEVPDTALGMGSIAGEAGSGGALPPDALPLGPPWRLSASGERRNSRCLAQARTWAPSPLRSGTPVLSGNVGEGRGPASRPGSAGSTAPRPRPDRAPAAVGHRAALSPARQEGQRSEGGNITETQVRWTHTSL